jgi:rhodanese-related sulfurtransferase
VYCRSGNRSKVAMEQMAAAGFTTMQDLDGGIVAWQAQGLPVTTG